MPQYLSPGVYVEEVPSAVKAIAGVSTSTAGFIGIVPSNLSPLVPLDPIRNEAVGTGDATTTTFKLARGAANLNKVEVLVNGAALTGTLTVKNEDGASMIVFKNPPPTGANITVSYTPLPSARVENEVVGTGDGAATVFKFSRVAADPRAAVVSVDGNPATDATVANKAGSTQVTFKTAPAAGAVITASYTPATSARVENEPVGTGDAKTTTFKLAKSPVNTTDAKVLINGAAPINASVSNEGGKTQVAFSAAPAEGAVITANYTPAFEPAAVGMVKLCTNFTEFKKFFGDFSDNADQSNLAHAVYGFFNNGGSRCHVARLAPASESPKPDLASVLEAFEAIDEISIVAAPGFTDKTSRDALITHCSQKTKSRFAILDSPKDIGTGSLDLTLFDPKSAGTVAPPNSDYAAIYFPWIQVFDPATKAAKPDGDGLRFVPPSGHVAGVYARVDTERGVHKAPANETVLGALGLRYALSKSQQDGLNPRGVNCIRSLNGNIRLWGARTAGGDDNADLKYINVRRTLIYLRGSIEAGTQWVVFEPNTPALWQKITRNVSAFLTNVWRSGALFGNTAAEAFYVKCDAENNPPELRELGQVVTEVGVAIVRPAEFVIFRISQFSAPGK
ncbi:MAG: phage tail sheath C-terminal domain-containing protein [Pyrinomonadaceae bacterium]